jgi:hypothetical protein
MTEIPTRRSVLFALAASIAGATAARAQDGGAFYNEQVRRNQQLGIPTQPAAVPPPTIRGTGAFDHDAVRARQEGVLGPRIPTRPTPAPQILTPDQRVATPAAPLPSVQTGSGRRTVNGRPVPIRRRRRRR